MRAAVITVILSYANPANPHPYNGNREQERIMLYGAAQLRSGFESEIAYADTL